MLRLTKEDYMKLPKERLAELLVERENHQPVERKNHQPVVIPVAPNQLPCCTPGGACTNPFHDCINCPKPWGDGGVITTTNTTIKKNGEE